MRTFVADLETTTNPNDCRVWAYAICEVGNKENIEIGNNLDDFMKWCANKKENFKVLFHNLKFDSQSILVWLLQNEYRHVFDQSERKTKTFTTIINDKGLYYQIEVIFQRGGKTVNKVVFEDSKKLVDMSVKEIAKTFNMPYQKLEIDYKKDRPIGYEITEEEKEYIKHDVLIVATAVEFFYQNNLTKMTIGSCAMEDYISILGKKNFKRFFPVLPQDRDMRQSYRGGFTYLNPKFEGKEIKNGIVLDYNSVYPSIMYDEILPYGKPIFFTGEYQEDKFYPLYIQMFRCQFELKKGMIPTVQIRFGSDYSANEYLTTSNGEIKTLCMTNYDLDLFKEHYEIYNIEYKSGWKFKGVKGLFKDYVEKWYKVKVDSKVNDNPGMYEISKRMLNALYGKFGTLPKFVNKKPSLNKNNIIEFNSKDNFVVYKDGVYVPMASFITSICRNRIITAAQHVMNEYNSGRSEIEFIYADTDSLHLKTDEFEIPTYFEYDDLKLGKFKVEAIFRRAKYLKQKCYIQERYNKKENDYNLKVTVAGMPEGCYQYVNFKNFKIGATYKGSLKSQNVPGGVVLSEVDFTIQKV